MTLREYLETLPEKFEHLLKIEQLGLFIKGAPKLIPLLVFFYDDAHRDYRGVSVSGLKRKEQEKTILETTGKAYNERHENVAGIAGMLRGSQMIKSSLMKQKNADFDNNDRDNKHAV